MIRRFVPLLAALAVLPLAGTGARAQDPGAPQGVRIGLSYDPGSRPGIVVLPVMGADGDSVRAILERDLDYGDRVNVIGGAPAATATVNYALYARLGAAALVQATLGPGSLTIAVHDVAQRKVARTQAFALAATPNDAAWRMALHRAADEVEAWIFGSRGIAATRVAYVRGGRLYLTHSDGAVTESVSSSSGTALSPAWHPGGRYLAYSELGPSGTQILVRDLSTGSTKRLASGGLNITPAFSPRGDLLAYSHGREAGADIYVLDPFTSAPPRRVTVGRGTLNMSPSFSPDGRRMAFTTDRPGRPDLYMADVDGTNAVELLPFEFGDQSYRSNPDWSPDGRQVAFQSQLAGRFQVMTLTLRDRNVKQHTVDGSNEDPSWAPDGRHLVYTSDISGSKQLWVLDTETGRKRQLTRAAGARLAAWSARVGATAERP